MFVLALDTTTKVSSRALARDGVLIREEGDGEGQQQAERLPGDLATLLAHAEVALHQVDLFAVATGPGSFTGMRIGIAAMQGLAFATGKPLVGVSALDALAAIAGAPRVATWVDAWRGEVYAALYGDGRELMAPVVEKPEQALDRLQAETGDMLFIGDGAASFAPLIERTLGARARLAPNPTPLLAGTIALRAGALAGAMLARAEALPPPHAIRPLYVRRPDAELARDRR